MSKTLIKANYVNVEGKDKKRVIDSNQAVTDRLRVLNEILEASGMDAVYDSEFSEGLGAQQLDALFADGEVYGQEQQMAEPSFSQEDIDRMISEANEQADAIVAEANERAEAIINGANAEATDIRQRAHDDGMAAGEEAGYNAGLQKVAEMEAELENRRRELEAEYEEMVSQLEPRFVETLTGIYEHIFHVDLSGKTELILYLLKDAIRNIQGAKNFFVHVSNADYSFVEANKESLMEGLATSSIVEIVEDISLAEGECFVEAESGIFDCGIDTELELLKKELMQLSYTSN